eukprot:symbB.v1.2.025320.t1/scaffold2451.1/size78874/5
MSTAFQLIPPPLQFRGPGENAQATQAPPQTSKGANSSTFSLMQLLQALFQPLQGRCLTSSEGIRGTTQR